MGLHGNEIRIRVAAPPVDGAANEALVRFLAERLDVGRPAVAVTSGSGARSKTVIVTGLTPEQAARRLGLTPPPPEPGGEASP